VAKPALVPRPWKERIVRRLNSKKTAVAAGTVAAVVAASGVAYAFWTETGSGSTSAGAASTSALTFTGDASPAANLYPGASGVNVTVNVGSTNSGTVHFSGTVTVNGASVSADPGHSGCTAALAALSGSTTVTDLSVPPAGTTFTIPVAMADTAGNQNPCKGATFTIPLTVS
jgi:hypothetical protein